MTYLMQLIEWSPAIFLVGIIVAGIWHLITDGYSE